MSGGFFRGTSADQDTRFSNKQAKLMKSQKFAPELEHLVDMTKVKIDVLKPWIATRVTEFLGFEDEVLINFIYGLLDTKEVNGKEVQISLTGFMEKNTGKFMKELWTLLLSAQNNVTGVPQQFLDAKEEETRKKKAEADQIAIEIQTRKDKEAKEYEQARLRKGDETDKSKDVKAALELNSKMTRRRASSADLNDEKETDENNGFRGQKRVSKFPNSPRRSPSSPRENPRLVRNSHSRSRSHSKSKSVSNSPQPRGDSASPEKVLRASRRRSITPRRRRSPSRSLSPSRRKSSHYKRRSRSSSYSRSRSVSPVRRRFRSPVMRRRSPFRRRSPSPFRRRFRSPVMRRRSPTPVSRSPPMRRRSPSPTRARSPIHVRRRSPSPTRARSPIHVRRRSPSPTRARSPNPVRRRSPSPVRCRLRRSPSSPRHISPVANRRRSPILSRHRSRSPYRQSPPSPIRSPSPIQKKLPENQRRRSPMQSPREGARSLVKNHAGSNSQALRPSSTMKSPQWSTMEHGNSRKTARSRSPSIEKSPVRSRSPSGSRKIIDHDDRISHKSPVRQTRIENRGHPQKTREDNFLNQSPEKNGKNDSREDRDYKSQSTYKRSSLSSVVDKEKDSTLTSQRKEDPTPERENVSGKIFHPKSPTANKHSILVEKKTLDEKIRAHDGSEIVLIDNIGSDVKEKRKHKRSDRHGNYSDDDNDTSDSQLQDRKEAKKRRKEEKRVRKEERRRRHSEKRRKRREEKALTSDADVAESEQKKLEIELRKKALESLRAKKGINN